MIGGKKIQNFITFQTKQTIFLKQNQPQLIVHQQKIETDSFKQLLSTKRSKNKQKLFQNPKPKDQKENIQSNQPKKSQQKRKNHPHSSNSKSKNTSKQRSSSARYNIRGNENIFHPLNNVKQFDLKEQTKRSKSAKNKLSKKAKSMIRLPKYADKNFIEIDPSSKINRKSYSPLRNFSEGMKKTNPNNCSTQCIKTTKFTESKDTTLKHLKSTKIDKTQKKESGSSKTKNTKSKQKLKGKLKNQNELRSYATDRKREEDVFQKIDEQKGKKMIKRISPSKKSQSQKKKIDELQNKLGKTNKQKNAYKIKKGSSKSKKNLHHFQSVDEMLLRHEKYDTTKNESSSIANYLSSRDSFKKKIKTDRDSLNKPNRKTSELRQKQIIISSKNLKKIHNDAAVKIQKVYKGYITRKWLNEYLKIIRSVVLIQKNWRGFMARKRFCQLRKKVQIKGLELVTTPRVNPVHPGFKEDFNEANINMGKWKDILFQVMEEKTVNQKLKSKIKQFLEHQNYHSARSSVMSQKSYRSHNSQQKLQQEIESERRFFQKKQQKKQDISKSNKKSRIYLDSPQSFHLNDDSLAIDIQSPSGRKSSRKESQLLSHLMSPENRGSISPKLSKAESPLLRKSQSPQKMIMNLQQIQNYQRQNILKQAISQKQELQELVKKNIVSPRSSKLKQDQIDRKMKQSLKLFDQNIENVIESCKRSTFIEINAKEVQSFTQSVSMTPQNSQVKETLVRQEIQNLSENEVKSRLFEQFEDNNSSSLLKQSQIGIELKQAKSGKFQLSPSKQLPTYENFQTFNVNAVSCETQQVIKVDKFQTIDSSCSFLDEYLLTMIEYLRSKNDGKVMLEIVRNLKNYRNLQPYVVLRNLSIVKEEDSPEDDGFCLPMYKYLQDDMEIIKQEYVNDYNKYFQMMRSVHKFEQNKVGKKSQQNELVEHYLKLLVDAFNQALNMKRPYSYIFTDKAVETFNSKMIIERQQFDAQSQYDIYCAGAMQEIFTWFNVRYGCIVSANEEETTIQEIVAQNAVRLNQIMKMEVDKKWEEYYEKIQTIAKISEELFEYFIVKETITMMNVQKKFLKQRQIFK